MGAYLGDTHPCGASQEHRQSCARIGGVHKGVHALHHRKNRVESAVDEECNADDADNPVYLPERSPFARGDVASLFKPKSGPTGASWAYGARWG